MSFQKYTNIDAVLNSYPDYQARIERCIPDELPDFELPNYLAGIINKNLQIPRINEFVAGEFLIVPVLREIWSKHYEKIQIWSHPQLKYDDQLTGNIDYLFSYSTTKSIRLGTPLVAVVEAKHEKFNKGWGQCFAEMIACHKLNGSEKKVYGIVTTGELWQFGVLENGILSQNDISYIISDLQKLTNVLDYILRQSIIDQQL